MKVRTNLLTTLAALVLVAILIASAGMPEPAAASGLAETTATLRWNNIAIPLDAGIDTADEVAAYIDGGSSSVVRVAKWDETAQSLVIRNVGSAFGIPNFSVSVGDWLLIGVTASAPTSFAWAGSVPAPGSRTYSIVQNGYSALMLPLDRADITTADALGAAIGHVTRVARWDAESQSLIIRNVNSKFGTPDFALQIGEPYLILATESRSWP